MARKITKKNTAINNKMENSGKEINIWMWSNTHARIGNQAIEEQDRNKKGSEGRRA